MPYDTSHRVSMQVGNRMIMELTSSTHEVHAPTAEEILTCNWKSIRNCTSPYLVILEA